MANKVRVPATSDVGSQELTEEIIQMRAYYFFEQRGYQHGHDMEDWLRAEAEVMGRKSDTSADQTERAQEAAAAA
jgi:Protein of unknown function (DUF2934)